ncbi:hypothetical protein ABW20_dc0107664 [Dactylellina cionopaga]|nr:hypothetical protein ABW20_dc0107664 [Dactylellina cionopaga]
MKLQITYALLALIPSIASHAVIIEAYGEANPKVLGCALGVVPTTPRTNTGALGQQDTGVFSDPTIPGVCKKAPMVQGFDKSCTACQCNVYCKVSAKRKLKLLKLRAADPNPGPTVNLAAKIAEAKAAAAAKAEAAKQSLALFTDCRKFVCTGGFLPDCQECPGLVPKPGAPACRQPLPTGCGRTQFVDNSNLYTIDGKDNWGKMTGELNIETWTTSYVQKKTIPQVYAGGVLFMKLHQINPDGGGPYTCIIDYGGKAQQWESVNLTMLAQIPGVKGLGPFQLKTQPLNAKLPENMKCTGTYGGAKKICMVRCHNEAPNGPFGGCVPIQQVGGDPPEPPASIPVKPVFTPLPTPIKPSNDKIYEEYKNDKELVVAVQEDAKVPKTEADDKNKEEKLNPEQIALLEKAGYYNKINPTKRRVRRSPPGGPPRRY